VKVAYASDPRTSSFAVYPDATGMLRIWGLVDQQNRYHDFVDYHAESGPQRPGMFQVETVGLGHIRVLISYERVAELKVNRLMGRRLEVFERGPIWDLLRPGILNSLATVEERLMQEGVELKIKPLYEWTTSLCRLILRIQNYRHGGALLLTPDTKRIGLKVRHALDYLRLRTAIENKIYFAELTYKANRETGKLWNRDKPIPIDLYLDELVNDDDLRDARSELDGAIWFVSLLSRVDGLVLLTPEFDVKGFGVEINIQDIPRRIFMARSESGRSNDLVPLDYERFGTRHRSMIRYCAAVPGSIGVVVSQDGDVRIATSRSEGVLVWENVKLQLDTPERRRSQSKPTNK
jgi:hypothetical protein